MKIIADLENGLHDGLGDAHQEVKKGVANVKDQLGTAAYKAKRAEGKLEHTAKSAAAPLIGRSDSGEPARGTPKSYPVQQPPNPRKSQGFWCGDTVGCLPPYFLLMPCCTAAYFCAGCAILSVISFVLLSLWLVLGPICCCCWARMRLWDFGPWNFDVDFYTKCLFSAYQNLFFSWEAPDTSSQSMPANKLKPKRKLEKTAIPYAINLWVPVGQEEEFKGEAAVIGPLAKFLEERLATLPQTERFDTFAEDEDPVEYVMKQMGQIYPRSYQDWPDKRSDMALTRFCLYGLGAHRIESTVEDGVQYFVVRTNALAGLPVRKGYGRYGGDAFFDSCWRPVKIVDAGLGEVKNDGTGVPATSRPGDQTWEEAKFRFRSSVSVLVTVVDHLYWIHLQLSNLMTIAVREHLAPEHPMRRFMTPFTYYTINVNDNAKNNLIQPRSMAPRCFALTDVGFSLAYAAAPKLIFDGFEVPASEGGPLINRVKYTKWLRDRRGIDTEFHRQCSKTWSIMRQFVVDYMGFYYPTHAEVAADKDLVACLRQFAFQLEMGAHVKRKIDPTGKSDKEVFECIADNFANHLFFATAMHEQYGAVEAYVQDVSFCAFKWVAGQRCGTKQTATAQALLMSFTSTPMPRLLGGNWTHLFPPPRLKPSPHAKTAEKSFHDFQDALQARAAEAEAYNAASTTRPFPECFPLYVMNPKNMESSVSV